MPVISLARIFAHHKGQVVKRCRPLGLRFVAAMWSCVVDGAMSGRSTHKPYPIQRLSLPTHLSVSEQTARNAPATIARMTDAPLETLTIDPARRRGMALVFLAGVLWSTMGLGIRLIEEAGVWQILCYRSISLVLFLGTVIWLRSGTNPLRMARATGLPGLVGAMGLIAAYSGGIFAVQKTSVANAMLLFAVAPFLAAILGRIVLGEKVRAATWVAIAVALGGVFVMVSGQGGQSSMAGNLAALGSACGFAVFTVALRRGKSTEMLPAVFLSGLLAIVLTSVISLVSGASLVLSHWDGGVALTLGVFQVGLGLMCYTIGSKTVPAVELTLLSLAEVVLGPVWVWLVLGETVGTTTLLGGAILLGAIIGNAVSGTRRRAPVHMP